MALTEVLNTNKTQIEKKTRDKGLGKDEKKHWAEYFRLMNGALKAFEWLKEDADNAERDSPEPEEYTVIYRREESYSYNEVKERKDYQVNNIKPQGNITKTSTFGDNDKQCYKKDVDASCEIDVSTERGDWRDRASNSFGFDDIMKGFETADENTTVECFETLSAGFVPAFKVSGWPRVADDWPNRERKWPPLDVMEEVMKTSCQVIVKPLPDKVKDDGSYTPTDADNMFRLSFALHELILDKSLNKTQITCWKILKAFQKSIFEITPRVMTSYLWKNAVFWICEETELSFWKPENTLKGTIKALDFTSECLKTGFFPQYFVKNMNLIKHCNANSVEKTVVLIDTLRQDPVSQLRLFSDFPPKPKSLKLISTCFRSLKQVMDKNNKISFLKDDMVNVMRFVKRQTLVDKFYISRILEGLSNMAENIKKSSEIRENEFLNKAVKYFSISLEYFRQLAVKQLRDVNHETLLHKRHSSVKSENSICHSTAGLLPSQTESQPISRSFAESVSDKERQFEELELD